MDRRAFLTFAGATALGGCSQSTPSSSRAASTNALETAPIQGAAARLLAAAHEQTRHAVSYDSGYTRIPYPMGDVAANKGVCTDVVIRAYRKIGIDLQQRVHEDMVAHFSLYPKTWGLTRADSNIDHRRVPNLRVFLGRFASARAVTTLAKDYAPGDLVTYQLPGNHPHIAIVSDQYNGDRPLVIHNIGWGPKQEDSLFAYEINGHYRYEV